MNKLVRNQVIGRFSNGRFWTFDAEGLRCQVIRRPFMFKGFKVEIRDNAVFFPFRYEWKITAISDSAKQTWTHWNVKKRRIARKVQREFIETDPTSWLFPTGDCSAIDHAKEEINFLTSKR